MLTDNESDDQTIKSQRLRKNQHDQHAHKQLILISIPPLLSLFKPTAPDLAPVPAHEHHIDIAAPVPHTPHAVISNDADAPSGGQAGEPAAQPGAEVGHAGVDGVDVFARVGRGGDVAGQDDGDDESVDSNDSRHDDGNDVLHDRAGMANPRVEEAHAGFPRSPRRTPIAQHRPGRHAHVSQTQRPRRAESVFVHHVVIVALISHPVCFVFL
mmetsp:Transcript_1657/g.2958  ORF Transcript_1657/g.2958 Transcript_1657/m.2958 type:complete len:212 (+) Transcript_1657:317-952(+)